MSCTCSEGQNIPRPCPVHWPDYTVRAIDAASRAITIGIDLASGKTIAVEAVNKLGELILPHLPDSVRDLVQQLVTRFGPVAIEHAVMKAPSLEVVDERTPGAPSSVELVDERS